MKKFRVLYNYVIRNIKSGEVVRSKKDTFEVEAETRSSVDTDAIRAKIRGIANEARKDGEEILHANYYGIEEV